MKPCLTLTEVSKDRLVEKIKAYSGHVPLIEVRIDFLEQPQVPELEVSRQTEFIATYRPAREGGHYRGSESARLQLLQKAAQSGFQWIDLEHDAVLDLQALPGRVKVIRSFHSFGRFPDNLQSVLHSLQSTKPDVSKLAVSVDTTQQLVRLLRLLEQIPAGPERILIGMGAHGQASRYLGALLGNAWTYVCEDSTQSAAPGQFSLDDFRETFPAGLDPSRLEIYGVLGNPIEHSLSPRIHNALFQHYGLNKVYIPILLDSLDEWLEYLRGSSLDFSGFSVTLPFKTRVPGLVRRVDSPVRAANTLYRLEGQWAGLNTDLSGFLNPLRKRVPLQGKTALVLGAGGVAHTVVAALQSCGVQVTVAARNPLKLERFSKEHACDSVLLSKELPPCDILINTTPVGQHPEVDQSPLHPGLMTSAFVYDLVYHPEETMLLKEARSRGLATISGVEMFVEQAALQFHRWTGIDPDREFMSRVVRGAVERSSPPSAVKHPDNPNR